MLALPGHRVEPSRFILRLELAAGAVPRCREVLVLGRDGERPGRLSSAMHVSRAGRPVLRQRLEIGDPVLDASLADLAGRRVLATALVEDAITALRWIDGARVCGA